MKCRLCGARVLRKNDHCTQCGAKIMRNPHAIRKLMFRLVLLFILLIIAGIIFIIGLHIFDRTHRSKALLQGLYTGMTKQEMIQVLKEDYPMFYNGKQMKNANAPAGADDMTYVAYAEYCNALDLKRPMCLEVHFFTAGKEQYVHSYTISTPYTFQSTDGGTDKVVAHDIQTKVVPALESKYGTSEAAEGDVEYLKHFNVRESVTAKLGKVSKLLGFQDALLNEFKTYESTNICIGITYEGFSSASFRKWLFG